MKRMHMALVIAMLVGSAISSFGALAVSDSFFVGGSGSWLYSWQSHRLGNDNSGFSLSNFELDGAKDIGLAGYLSISLKLQDNQVEIQKFSYNRIGLGFLKGMALGRFAPPFGGEWSEKDLDQLNTISYSAVDSLLVYRDDGIRIDAGSEDAKISFGAFMGRDRIGGLASERQDSKLHLYSRLKLELLPSLKISGSYRWSRTRHVLWAGNLDWNKAESETMSLEVVGFGKNTPQWYLMYAIKITHNIWSVIRYENLTDRGNVITSGVKVEIRNFDFKLNSVQAKDLPKTVNMQMVVHF